jgi:hypothetical protein
LLRRILLGAVTALVVARPLVPGEDPGRLLIGTGVADQWFTFLWLLVAAGWGVWRAWSREGAWFGSLVEVGLLGLAGLAFGSALQGGIYRHAALAVAGQWGTLVLAFCLVRQLVRSPADNQALLAALIATGVSLAVYATYQARQADVAPPPPDPTLTEIFGLPTQPVPPAAPAATFVQPAVFAGFLALLLPPLIGAGLASWRVEQLSWRTGIIVACCILFAGALFVAQGWWTILLLMLVGTYAIFFWGRPFAGRLPWVLAGLVALVLIDALVIAVAGFDRLRDSLAERTATWQACAALTSEHPWLGVGPGNLSRELPAKLESAALAPAADPHNLFVEAAVTLGLGGLALLLLTLVVFFWRVVRTGKSDEEPRTAGTRTPWEFYLGGVVGLSLGFVLRFNEIAGQDAVIEALVALCRSLVWFGAFAVLESVPWTGRGRALALGAGVAALLLNLLFEGGIGYPSLAQPLWVMAALTLNALPEAPVWEGRHWLAHVIPAPILGVACLGFLIFVFYPAAAAASSIAKAHLLYRNWRDDAEPAWHAELDGSKTARERWSASNKADSRLYHYFIEPLDSAAQDDPGNAAVWAEQAYWYSKQWRCLNEVGKIPNEEREKELQQQQLARSQAAIAAAQRAQDLDPKGPEGYWAMYLLCNQFARAESGQAQRTQYRFAAVNLGRLVAADPNDPRLRFLLAEALFKAGDAAPARAEAQRALDLDKQAPGRRKLTVPQVEQALKWLSDTAVR